MIVKNEEANLQTCLDSMRGLANEIVIVDTGSTDATPQIAARNGASLIPFDFAYVDFAAARNQSLAHAHGDWIFVLDADETLYPASIPVIEELTAGNERIGYYAERHNPTGIDYAVRLFPNSRDYRYRGRVHETITTTSRLRRSAIRIDHHHIQDADARCAKNHRYIAILKEEIAAHPTDDTRLDFLAAEYHQLEMYDEATAVAERIVEARPQDPTAHLNAGIYHLIYRPDPARARADFRRALELKPGYPEALAFLSQVNNT